MDLPILQQYPQIREKPSEEKQKKNDILQNVATGIVEFLEDVTTSKPIEKTWLEWFDNILFKNDRIMSIGVLLLLIGILLFISK